jgi:hypothetical protein
MIPTNPNAKLRRKAAAEALSSAGFQTAEATLASMASRGGGPPYELYGRFPIYTWSTLLAWAESRLSAPRRSTAEADAQEGASMFPSRPPMPSIGPRTKPDAPTIAAIHTLPPVTVTTAAVVPVETAPPPAPPRDRETERNVDHIEAINT